MAESDDLRAELKGLHDRIDELLRDVGEARLRGTPVPDIWNVLDVIAHINSWGLLFLNDARFMARHPGQPIPYTLYSTSRYDDENEALVERRRGWTVSQYAEENGALSEALGALIDSFAGNLPDFPVAQPWQSEPLNLAGVLAYHAHHGVEHLSDIEAALRLERA